MLSISKFCNLKYIFQVRKFNFQKCYTFSSFNARDFLSEVSHGEAGTLTTRFIKHIAIDGSKHEKIIHQTIKYSDYFPISEMRNFYTSLTKTPTEQLPRLAIFFYTYKSNGDVKKFSQALNEIDSLCVKRINEFDSNGLLSMMYAFTYLIPNKITKLEFYKAAVPKLVKNFHADPDCHNVETFVQICFYLGLWKKNQHSTQLMTEFLKLNLHNYLEKLNKVNLAIVANAAFKASVNLSDKNFTDRLKNETVNCDYKDDQLLVTFVKSLRLERIKSCEVYNKLKSLIVYDKKLHNYHFKGLVHIFAYFSDGFWNDTEVCKILPEICLGKIQNIGIDGELFNDIREKDIATLIWSFANLQCSITETDLSFIEDVIVSRINRDKYKYCPDELIDSVLSLWIMNYKSQKLIADVLKLNSAKSNFNKTERVKLNSRFKLLINCVRIEYPHWLPEDIHKEDDVFNENRNAPEYLLKNRNNLNKISNILLENKEVIEIKSTEFILPISELNISSIRVDFINGQKALIEVVEDDQLLKFDNKVSSLVQLKLRLLSKLGVKVILVKPDEIAEKDALLRNIKAHLNLENTSVEHSREQLNC